MYGSYYAEITHKIDFWVVFVLVIFVLLNGCASSDSRGGGTPSDNADLFEFTGTIKYDSPIVLSNAVEEILPLNNANIISDSGEHYSPINLSREYFVNDLRVRVIARELFTEGTVQNGILIEILEIEILP